MRGAVAVYGKIAADEGSGTCANHRPKVMDHFIQRDLGGIGVSEHHHAEGIADQKNMNPRLIQESGGGVIIGGQCRDRHPTFHRPNAIDRQLGPLHDRDVRVETGACHQKPPPRHPSGPV